MTDETVITKKLNIIKNKTIKKINQIQYQIPRPIQES